MPKKQYFSYIRVSTQRQGLTGTSLAEQQASIERFAQTWDLSISKRFEERETAAKQGRPVFLDMLRQLRQQKADGLIIHKIDRSARNLKDWADLGSLIDSGLEVHFASEGLDLRSRGGRLSADIQAVVASDYIRNLREETKKGLYGRLKQGLFPFPAVTGYLDMGQGKPKLIDPNTGPLVRKAFELYSKGTWGLIDLSDHLFQLGLRNKQGRRITSNRLSEILHNPFYTGVIRIKTAGELFPGIHEPLIAKSLFDLVQRILDGKNIHKKQRHFYAFRRFIRCINCSYNLVPEIQKHRVYYRCHTKNCLAHCLREDFVNDTLLTKLKKIEFSDGEYEELKRLANSARFQFEDISKRRKAEILLQQSKIRNRQSRLIDAYMEGVIDKEAYLEKKNHLATEEHSLKEQLKAVEATAAVSTNALGEFLELANSAYLSYKAGNGEQRRELVKIMTSNFTSDGKSVFIKLEKPFEIVAEREQITSGGPYRDRTGRLLLAKQALYQMS